MRRLHQFITHITATIGLIQEYNHWFIGFIILVFISVLFSIAVMSFIYKKSYSLLRDTLPDDEFRNQFTFYYSLHMLTYIYLLVS